MVAVALVHEREERVEVGRAGGVDGDAARLHPQQLHGGVEDHTREPHAADGRPEQVGPAIGPDVFHGAVGQQQREPLDVIAE